MLDPFKFDEFTKAYMECLLWSTTDGSNDQGGEPLDSNYDFTDFSQEALETIEADCRKFQHEHYGAISNEVNCTHIGDYPVLEYAGHDFWLTRNGHGAGFWDGDWPEVGEYLTQVCSLEYPEQNPYVGVNGKIYLL